MSTIIQSIENEQRRTVPRFDAGDRVRVHFRVVEGTRTRTQVFEGVVIRRQGSGVRETFTVRKQSFGVGVERTFPVHSPKIEELEIAARGRVRRAKLYYLRDRVGKRARVAERRWGISEEALPAPEAAPLGVDGSGQSDGETESAVPSEPQDAAVEETGAEDVSGEDTNAEDANAEDANAEDVASESGAKAEAEATPDDEAGGSTEDATGAEADEKNG